ncbi:MAG: hypothetical protein FWG20_02535, partial [Candidatus Cloacimonetes bacterium]|nr:hypothetical protein [Candidatus Cloacimonadota bacterium]
LEIAENLLKNDVPFTTINIKLGEFFDLLMKLTAGLKDGTPLHDLLIEHKIYTEKTHEYRQGLMRGLYQRYLGNYDQKKILKAQKAIYTCDCQAKSADIDDKILLTLMIYSIF